ncbi:hypothetical protein PF005_g3167 [Phytophthora fragariae]|uniref:Uncharacterized protein n=1 Tax=Phytophthora fragariae TaxID=53985 RepID=A0A6A3Z6A4_9STRA|nr:hypothetical protein PF009_g3180 [Phytophthora fragariae]KAE9026415.1 hypothetical protein PF011_g2543 [Phytophthora fragariae]KAE9134054.1 hypothetical protein PF007_g3085 [Phytophthora fragariae]KAE9231217.1 hypothetical protein PF005_g3167 [Phytophthora fragariae]
MAKEPPTSKPADNGDAAPLKSKATPTPSFSLVTPLLVVAAALGWGKLAQRELQAETVEELVAKQELVDKYDDKMLIAMEVRHLVSDLSCSDDKYAASPLFDGQLFPVQEPMQLEQPMDNDRVFFMLNGRNEGVYVSWNGEFNCVGKAAELAADWLGADRDVMENCVRLYNQMGFAIRSTEDLAQTKNIVHILLDFQVWQWPGIEKGTSTCWKTA